jgi:hypothetical protein
MLALVQTDAELGRYASNQRVPDAQRTPLLLLRPRAQP